MLLVKEMVIGDGYSPHIGTNNTNTYNQIIYTMDRNKMNFTRVMIEKNY